MIYWILSLHIVVLSSQKIVFPRLITGNFLKIFFILVKYIRSVCKCKRRRSKCSFYSLSLYIIIRNTAMTQNNTLALTVVYILCFLVLSAHTLLEYIFNPFISLNRMQNCLFYVCLISALWYQIYRYQDLYRTSLYVRLFVNYSTAIECLDYSYLLQLCLPHS